MTAKQFSDFAGNRGDPPPTARMLVVQYRPKTFANLVGHGATMKSLAEAIRRRKLPNALLLTGPRGVGKTLSARLIAKAYHCVGLDRNGQITPEPCGQCGPCKAIADGSFAEVFDLDCQRGDYDVGEVIQALRSAPPSTRPRICIFDEVHRLKPDALAALADALGAPPPNAKIILATWLPDTLPASIRGHCHKIELRPIPTQRLAAHLARVCRSEGKTPDPQMIAIVASAAKGSVRDGLMMLDGLLCIDKVRLSDWPELRKPSRSCTRT